MFHQYKLKNGIPVFVAEHHAAPVVSIQLWVSRGSADERSQEAGISHFLEHAVFKGTKKRGVGKIAADIERRGGEINAFTSFDETCYYATLASRYFEHGLDVLSDLIQNPVFDAEEMRKEREVILEEIRRAHDATFKTVSMNLWSMIFASTPYGRPVLGYTKTVSKLDHRSLSRHFREHYHAGTTALIVAGDIEPRRVLKAATKMLSRMPKRKVKVRGATSPKRQSKPSFQVIERDVKECQLQVGWAVPPITEDWTIALDLATSAIGQGESCRLHQRLVKESQQALAVSFGMGSTRTAGMTALTLVTTPENLYSALEAALSEIRNAAEHGISSKELGRVKTSLESDVVSAKETVDGLARRLGHYYMLLGNPEGERDYLEKLILTSKPEAEAALHRILSIQPTLSLAVPVGMRIDEPALMKTLAWPASKKRAAVVADPLEKHQTRGITWVSKATEHLPTLSLRMVFPGGSREEQPNQLGLANLLQRTWTSGTARRNAVQITHQLESLGASLFAFSGRHTFGLGVDCLTKHWDAVRSLLEETLLTPSFPEAEVQLEKELVLREILSERDSPGQMCQLNFLESLYGNHPYGRSGLGTQASVKAILRSDLETVYKRLVRSGKIVVSCVGAVTSELIREDLSPLLESLSSENGSLAPAMNIAPISTIRVTTAQKTPLQQAHLLVGFLGPKLMDSDRYALKLLSSCLAGQGGRLFLELRDKQSLAYQVSPMSSDSPEGGMFGFYIGCAPDKTKAALRGIRIELDRVLETSIPGAELQRAKDYWIGRFELDMQRNSAQAMTFALDEFYGMGFGHSTKVPELVQSITSEMIQNAARKFLRPDQAVISLVHPEKVGAQEITEVWKGKGASGKRGITVDATA